MAAVYWLAFGSQSWAYGSRVLVSRRQCWASGSRFWTSDSKFSSLGVDFISGNGFLFLWGVNFGPRGVDFVSRGVVLRFLGANFLPLKVDFLPLRLDFSLSEYVLSPWKWILIFGGRFWAYKRRFWVWEKKSRKSAWYHRHILRKNRRSVGWKNTRY